MRDVLPATFAASFRVARTQEKLVPTNAQFRHAAVVFAPGFAFCRYEDEFPRSSGPVVTVIDTSLGDRYEAGVREAWSEFMGQRPARVSRSLVLVTEELPAMTTSIVNAASGGVITQFADRTLFEVAVREAYRVLELAQLPRPRATPATAA